MGDGGGQVGMELVQADACRSLTWGFLVVVVVVVMMLFVGVRLACSHSGLCHSLKGKLLILDRDSDLDSVCLWYLIEDSFHKPDLALGHQEI